MTTAVLPDDLVVEILSRLPLKSFCRFKCVCKSWLAFSSDAHYRQKLPRVPAGLLCQQCELDTTIHLARLPASDGEIDTSLNFVPPRYKYSKLVDCCNGLLLCYQGDTEPGPPACSTDLSLSFDPLWSQHFYVFKFQSIMQGTITKVEVFFSENSSWSGCLWEIELRSVEYSLFVNGVLNVMLSWDHEIIALDAPHTSSQWLNHRIIQLPGFTNWLDMLNFCDERLSQSSGVLCYARQELDGCAVRIWSLEGPEEWVMKHRVSMTDVFGRDVLIKTDMEGYVHYDYGILAFDLERELVILVDVKADKIISVSISTGKGSQYPKLPEKFTGSQCSLFYVPYYGEVPALVR